MSDAGTREVRFVEVDCGEIAVHRWPASRASAPTLLLVHGTGFVASVWDTVATALRAEFDVVALDRRGHGASVKPDAAYDFLDFSADLVAVIERLELRGVYGVGHSAGATDILLAAAHRPEAFARIFAIEPTVMDPADPALDPAGGRAVLPEAANEGLENLLRRRARFASRDEVLGRYRDRDTFARWRPELLEQYVRHGFADSPDGGVELLCRPEIEVAMIRIIFQAMERVYEGGPRGNAFEALSQVVCPVAIAETEGSGEIYKQMVTRALRLVRDAHVLRFEGVGHCAAQEAPEHVIAAVRKFWNEAGT